MNSPPDAGSPHPDIDLAALSQGLVILGQSVSINVSHHQWGRSVPWSSSKKKDLLTSLICLKFSGSNLWLTEKVQIPGHSKSFTSWPPTNSAASLLILPLSLKHPVLPSYEVPPYSKNRSCSPRPPGLHTSSSLALAHSYLLSI